MKAFPRFRRKTGPSDDWLAYSQPAPRSHGQLAPDLRIRSQKTEPNLSLATFPAEAAIVTLVSASDKLESMQRQAQHAKKEIDVSGLPEEAIQAVQSVVSLLRGQPVDNLAAAEKSTDELLGLFRDEHDLLDQIVQEAMSARETQPLRLPRE